MADEYTPTEEYAIRVYALIEVLRTRGGFRPDELEVLAKVQTKAPLVVASEGARLYVTTR